MRCLLGLFFFLENDNFTHLLSCQASMHTSSNRGMRLIVQLLLLAATPQTRPNQLRGIFKHEPRQANVANARRALFLFCQLM